MHYFIVLVRNLNICYISEYHQKASQAKLIFNGDLQTGFDFYMKIHCLYYYDLFALDKY